MRTLATGVLLIALVLITVALVAQDSSTQQPASSTRLEQSKTSARTSASIRAAPSSEKPKSSPDCEQANRELQQFLDRAPHGCRKDSECDGYYLSANSCAPAVVLRRPGIRHEREPELLRLQSRARNVCAEQWSKQPACAPIPFRAACLQNRCTDRTRQK